MKKEQYKFTRPANPFTAKVIEDITIKTNTLLGKFKDFANEEKREYRRNDISSRLAGAVMKAHRKFKDNDRCSFETFADLFIVREVSHYKRDNVRVIEEERVTRSGDKPVRSDHSNGNDEDGDDAPTYFAGMASPRDYLAECIDTIDLDDITVVLMRQNRLYARIFSLRRDGYKLSEISPIIGVPQWELYDILWPAVKAAVKQIYDFQG